MPRSHPSHKVSTQPNKRQKTHPPTTTTTTKPPVRPVATTHPQPTRKPKPIIPFLPTDRILLVGEGDFSFAHSLLTHYEFSLLVATSLDSREVVLEKYPHAGPLLRVLENPGEGTIVGNGGEVGSGSDGDERDDDEEEEEEDDEVDKEGNKIVKAKKEVRIKFGIDATKLTMGKVSGRKKRKKGGTERGFDKIGFNFPHVGGKTKDVNRQVRFNQELLVQFFTSALPLLAPSGSIIVTLFEGEPYQLWNIRDLARHVGLKVGRSFTFQADAYPGYSHARTLGTIEGGGGWKGEERAARMYVFEVADEGGREVLKKKKKRKRRGEESGDDDDDDDDDDEDG